MKRRLTSILIALSMMVGVMPVIGHAETESNSLVIAETTPNVDNDEIVEYYGGALKMTEERKAEFEKHTPKIRDVKLNPHGLQVIQGQTENVRIASEIEVAKFGEETVTDEVSLMSEKNVYSLPDAYDVSQNDSFPPIKHQGDLESCMGWSVGYYQLTNNIANVRGYNAKTGENAEQYRMSPMWLYNLINGGANVGTYIEDAVEAIKSFGGVPWKDCPGSSSTSLIKSWHPGAELWEKALGNKAECEYLVLSDENSMQDLKTLLCNGYVVSFCTDFTSNLSNWKKKTSEGDIVESVCYYVKEASRGHALTLVGYDDNIWVDVNGNGVKDIGETGAFKIANSWGTRYGNSGYIWLLYDALRQTTSIPGVSNQVNRTSAIWNRAVYFLKPYKSYEPLLLAEVTINTMKRNQLGIQFGISDITENIPKEEDYIVKSFFCNIAFNFPNKYDGAIGGGDNFTGGYTAANGTFVFDLTSILNKFHLKNAMKENEEYRFYVNLEDNTNDSNVSQLVDFKVIDRQHGVTYTSKNSMPITANGSQAIAYTDCVVVPKLVENTKNFNIKFNNYLKADSVINDNIYVENTNGQRVDAMLRLDANQVTVTAPEGGYEKNNLYKLFVKKDLLSNGGNRLINPMQMEFYITR